MMTTGIGLFSASLLLAMTVGCVRTAADGGRDAAPPRTAGAQVGRDATGRPLLRVDGKPSALNPGVLLQEAPAFAAVFGKAGLDQLVVNVNLGFYHSGFGWVAPLKHMREFWKGDHEYDPAELERLLGSVLQVRPDAKLILWLGIGEYPGFTEKHPDAIIRNDRGAAAVTKSHFQRFEPYPAVTPLKKPERYAVSFFSEAYRAEVSDMLEACVRAVEASPARDAVIGYLIGGGQDAQQYAWSPPDGSLASTPENWGDYSPAARQAFPGWLQRRYAGDLATLNHAWGATLTSFTTATPPPATDLAGPPAFHDPAHEMQAYDWKRFLAEGRAEFIIGMADRIRAAATRRVIIGTSGGDGGHRRDNTSTGMLQRSPSLDFFLHQATYGVRLPPSTGGFNAVLDSYGVNGKLFLTDMDHRLWTKARQGEVRISAAVSFNDDTVGHAKEMAMQRDMWRREYARLWVVGNYGAWHMSFANPADYDHPEILAEMRFLHERMQQVATRNAAAGETSAWPGSQAEVAFVFDEAAVDFARGALAEYHAAGMLQQWAEAHASGVPVRFYYAQDLRDGKVPPAKLYVLQNLLDLDDVLAKRIRALRQAGATVVALQGTGLVQLATGRESVVRETLGLPLRRLTAADRAESATAASAVSHPLLGANAWQPGVASLEAEKLKEVDGIALTVNDPALPVLARYPTSKSPAAVISAEPGSPVVFVGTYTLSRDLISRLAAYAGAWRIAPPGTVVAADVRLLMLHALTTGEVEIDLNREAALRELPPGTRSLPTARRHRLSLEAGRTALFDLE
jgi:hypothetical protein